jgi:hypothetical protein
MKHGTFTFCFSPHCSCSTRCSDDTPGLNSQYAEVGQYMDQLVAGTYTDWELPDFGPEANTRPARIRRRQHLRFGFPRNGLSSFYQPEVQPGHARPVDRRVDPRARPGGLHSSRVRPLSFPESGAGPPRIDGTGTGDQLRPSSGPPGPIAAGGIRESCWAAISKNSGRSTPSPAGSGAGIEGPCRRSGCPLIPHKFPTSAELYAVVPYYISGSLLSG